MEKKEFEALRRRGAGAGAVRQFVRRLADERGESDPVSMIAGVILSSFVMALLGAAFVQGIGASSHASGEQAAIELLQADASAWQTEPYAATDHAVTASAVSTSTTISGLPATVWRSVSKDSSGLLTGVWTVSRSQLGVRGALDAACSAGLESPASRCLVLSAVAYPGATDQLPPTPSGVTLATKSASRGVQVASLSISRIEAAGALDLRLSVKPAGVSASTLGTWRASLVCEDGKALTSSTPDAAMSPTVGGWSSARVTVAQATGACPTDNAQLVVWSTSSTQPNAAQIASGGVHVYRIGGSKQ